MAPAVEKPAVERFVKQLEDSGIITASELKHYLQPETCPKDAETLASELIKQNALTLFQARHVLDGKATELFLGNYTILDQIAAGRMGQVFKAEEQRTKRVVAIKLLPPSVANDPTAAARFQREVETAAKLEHPNIVTTYHADEANGARFLVMQFVDGTDLATAVQQNGPLAVGQAIDYILQAGRGLEFAHTKGVVHGDIKLANLLVDRYGTLKILGMGLASIGSSARATMEFTGNRDSRADIHGLGCLLYELVVGRISARGENPIRSLRDVLPEVPDAVEAVFRKMIAPTTEDCYRTIAEVVADLEKCHASIAHATTSTTRAGRPLPTVDPSNLSITFGHQMLKAIYASEPVARVEEPTAKSVELPKPAQQPAIRRDQQPWWKNPKLWGTATLAAILLGILGLSILFTH
jgi:serine/threonine protein kinase